MANRQPLRRIAKLIEKYPIIGGVRSDNRYLSKDFRRKLFPKTSIRFQVADPDLMQYELREVFSPSYLLRQNGEVGTLFQFVLALDQNKENLGGLYRDSYGKINKIADLFDHYDREKIRYILLVSQHEWYPPATHEQILANGSWLPGEPTERTIDFIVYRKPRDMSWEDLISQANRLQKENEDAWKNFPKYQPDTTGIEKALRDGFRLHAFGSGTGLRVVCLKKGNKETGYGEHPNIEPAIKLANEDYLAGGRPYGAVYGGKYPHYLTGSTLSTSNLDCWVRNGSTFDAWQDGNEIIFRLRGFQQYDIPKEFLEKARASNDPVTWQDRGYTFQTQYEGDNMFSLDVVDFGKHNPKKMYTHYNFTKTGRGPSFWEAVRAAFAAPEVEIEEANN